MFKEHKEAVERRSNKIQKDKRIEMRKLQLDMTELKT